MTPGLAALHGVGVLLLVLGLRLDGAARNVVCGAAALLLGLVALVTVRRWIRSLR